MKSIRALFLSLGMAVCVGLVYLVVLPIWQVNVETEEEVVNKDGVVVQKTEVNAEDPEAPPVRNIAEHLDTRRIAWGVFSMLAFAGVAIYLNTPGIKRHYQR